MTKLKTLIIAFAILLMGVVISIYFYPKVYPVIDYNKISSKDSIKIIAKRISEIFNNNIVEDDIDIELKTDKSLIKYLHQEFGLEEGNKIIRNLPAYYWAISVKNDTLNLKMQLSLTGKLISYSPVIDGNVYLNKYFIKDFANNNYRLLSNYYYYKDFFLDSIIVNKKNITNFKTVDSAGVNFNDKIKFVYSNVDRESRLKVNTKIEYYRNKIQSIKTTYGNLYSEEEDKNIESINSIIVAIIYISSFIMMIVLAYKKIRAYEISYKTGVIWGAVVAIIFVLTQISISSTDITGPIVGSIFIGFGLMIVWAISETQAREDLPEKFFGFDLLLKKEFSHSKIGENIITGVSLGIYISAIYMIIIYFAGLFFDVYFLNKPLQNWSAGAGGRLLVPIGMIIVNASFVCTIYLMLIPILLHKKIKSQSIVIILSALIYLLSEVVFDLPLILDLVVTFLIGAILIWIFLKYDFLTVLITYFFFLISPEIMSILLVDNYSSILLPFYLVILILILFIYAIYSILSDDKINDWKEVSPIIVKHISERQRLKGEFDTAHYVQMSFLPKSSPAIEGVDISSVCLSAKEIGGDYFDFIKYDENRFAFIIGDVSGKGARAAFFMTLIKGFVLVLREFIDSPKELMTKINKYFYESTVRGNFVTLLIGLIDIQKKKLISSRAGHNYLLILKNNGQIIEVNAKGLGIGIADNAAFNRTINEIETDIEKGDVIVAYTDGIIEAMNKFRIEYGYKNFQRFLKSTYFETAEELKNKIIADVKNHIGIYEQHDDMTLIIIRVL